MTCGTPGDIAFTAITTNQANAGTGFGTGWWAGLHIPMPEIINQFAFG